MKRNLPLTLYRLLAAMLCLYGQLGSFGILSGRLNWDAVCYFTNLSNILCLVTWLLLLWKPHGFAKLHGMAAQSILLTMVVFHALLSDFDFRIRTIDQFNNHVVHTFVPLLMIADFLFLRCRTPLPWYTPLTWVDAPMLYLGFALLMPTLEDHFFPGMTRYPYFFLSPYGGWLRPSPQGYEGVLLNCLVLLVAYIASGYVMYGAYLLAGWVRRKIGAA